MKQYKVLSLMLFALLSVGILRAEETKFFSNPVFAHDWADPDVWQGDDGNYYTFSTAGTSVSMTTDRTSRRRMWKSSPTSR